MTFLLTYPIVLLPWYNQVVLAKDGMATEDSIISLATKRFVTTLIGVIVAVIFTSAVWPFHAHTELRLSLGVTLQYLGFLYSKLTSLLLTHHDDHYTHNIQLVESMFREARDATTRHREMIILATLEPRIKGPFPQHIYTRINKSYENILEHFSSFLYVSQAGLGSVVVENLIIPSNSYRKELYAVVLLYFHILSGSLSSKAPLPPYMPNVRPLNLPPSLFLISILILLHTFYPLNSNHCTAP